MNTLRLYAALFANGAVKVGVTSNFTLRARALVQIAGCRMVSFAVSAPVDGRQTEALAHKAVGRVTSDRRGEWFYGVNYKTASQMVMQIARNSALCPTERSRRRLGLLKQLREQVVVAKPPASANA